MNGHRDWGGPSEEFQPVTTWRGYPIYTAHLIVIVYCALMIVTALFGEMISGVIGWLTFSSLQVWAGQVWRLATYGLFNYPSIQFALDMLMLVWFGRELERTFGRRTFGLLYGGIYLLPPVVLTLVGLLKPTALLGQPGTLALFVAFATQFPDMPIFFTLLARWAALILVGIFTLMALASRNWSALILLWSTCAYAHAFVRHEQGAFSLPRIRLWKRKPALRVLPDLPAAKPAAVMKTPKEKATMAEVDSLLDKIAKSGIGSLTAAERARLESAREDLMKRGSGRG
ncbi:rhomboid family intramembrane serine protease [Horticoccus sp. 23ND18S-11]|uniref:rhomboid family intramembrane serine protease n=1 Tax=Horticoccus sp. 23ND18S-11 TaxID=3391832 RepID=UPI0039C8D664